MKKHTQRFKDEIKRNGRQLDSKITYTLNNVVVELGKEQLNFVTPTFKSDILKSAMKELIIDSRVEIPVNTVINYKFGVLIDNEYEYLNFGNYIVKEVQKKEDTNSYNITCYDFMLKSMVVYEKLKNFTFPMTVRDFITHLSNELGLIFANENDEFVNYDKVISYDIYEGLGYTYRDIFDELSQVTASTICINDENKIEIRYINENPNYNEINGSNIIIENNVGKNVDNYIIEGKSIQDDTPSPTNPIEIKNVKGIDGMLNVISKNRSGQEKTLSMHLQDNEICSIGDIKDTLENGVLTKRIGKVVLNGSESWNKVAEGYYINTTKWGNSTNQETLSNRFKTYTKYRDGLKEEDDGAGFLYTNINQYYLKINGVDNVNDLKIWLSNNNVIVYYILKEEKKYNLTNEQLQLFDGYNNITTNDELQPNMNIRYIYQYGDMIDEEYLKNINVNFGEKYGPVNSIVLSRSAGSDNVYLRDEPSIEENGLCEIKITDNQIMNFNDRSDYLPQILNKLDGLSYYTNDYSSTGVCYYDICDKYNVKIGDNTYSCVMFNDEINVTQGLEENIYTEIPEESETDYTKSDKTDQKINQTYLIVDKQNQTIESVITNVDEQNDKISRVLQTVDELNSKISDVADITISGETQLATLDITRVNKSQPILVKIRPLGKNISALFPNIGLFPSNDLYLKPQNLIFKNNTTDEVFVYELKYPLLYLDSNTYDTFYMSYDERKVVFELNCEYYEQVTYSQGNNMLVGNVEYKVRKRVTKEVIELPYPSEEELTLTDGDYTIYLGGLDSGYMYVTLMAQNIYTTQFATKVELNTEIQQRSDQINLLATKKVGEDEIISKINQTPEQITIDANKLSLKGKEINLTTDDIIIESKNFKVDRNGKITATEGDIAGFITNSTSFSKSISGIYDYNPFDLLDCQSAILNRIRNLPYVYRALDYGGDGIINALDLLQIQKILNNEITNTKILSGKFIIDSNNPKYCISTYDQDNRLVCSMGLGGINSNLISCNDFVCSQPNINEPTESPIITMNGSTGNLYASGTITQGSLEELKKNFEKLDDGLEIIKNTDIYKYNLKREDDEAKKQIGFVIGDNYNYSSEITAIDDNDNEIGVNLYAMVSVCFRAIQQQQEEIEELKKEIIKLKGDEK